MSKSFHDWCVERELKALDNAWECEVQDIYERFLDAHRYTVNAENDITRKEYLDAAEGTLIKELKVVTKAYIEKRDEVKAKFSGNASEG
jgi:hypothetical protein